tara:strand:- start:313 stop:1098 length:786 start_codon:yes stop_codon:yes gene_type:complete
MRLPLLQIDAFASMVFAGNPAAIVPLDSWLSDDLMQSIALENQLSETAFFVEVEGGFDLRWFTPATEVDLCGHATLASAHALFEEMSHPGESIVFHTRSGALTVNRMDEGYEMDFPIDLVEEENEKLKEVAMALGCPVRSLWRGKDDLMAVLDTESAVAALDPDFRKIAEIPTRGILATAPGDSCDFVSRCFFPRFGIDEDPVTGSAHTTMAPYWGGELNLKTLRAAQLSFRGGEVECELVGDRVKLRGQAITFMRGEIEV